MDKVTDVIAAGRAVVRDRMVLALLPLRLDDLQKALDELERHAIVEVGREDPIR